MHNDQSISKRNLWRYINRKIKRTIHHYHVFSVIAILFEEIIKDLKIGKEIKIVNLGTLSLRKTKPRLYHNVKYKKVMLSKGYRLLKFSLAAKIRKKLRAHVDLDKTFKDD